MPKEQFKLVADVTTSDPKKIEPMRTFRPGNNTWNGGGMNIGRRTRMTSERDSDNVCRRSIGNVSVQASGLLFSKANISKDVLIYGFSLGFKARGAFTQCKHQLTGPILKGRVEKEWDRVIDRRTSPSQRKLPMLDRITNLAIGESKQGWLQDPFWLLNGQLQFHSHWQCRGRWRGDEDQFQCTT